MADNKKSGVWKKLFPSFFSDSGDNRNVMVPAGGVYEDWIGDAFSQGGVLGVSTEDGQELFELPKLRHGKYGIFDIMASDPTIDSALKMHIAHALSARSDTGEIIKIESVNDETNAVVKELQSSIQHMVNRDCHSWAYNAALYGSWYVRAYTSDKEGIKALRSDFYTHPKFINEYLQGGRLAGFSSSWQQPGRTGLMLMEPWSFVGFKIPIWSAPKSEPQRIDATPFDISADIDQDHIVESQNYGQSMIESAFAPWMDLLDAITAMNMSRKNAARIEQTIGVNTGKLNPQKAAQYLNTVASQLQKVDRTNAEKSLRKGFLQTVIRHIIPIFGDGRGRLDVQTVEGSPNIDGLADIDFHIKRLGSALGIDPSLLGFGEMLSGGLGDGGFFRVSVLASIKADLLRQAIKDGVDRICEIHIASKMGKVFLPGEKPWRVNFNSVSTALEREERENMEGRAAFATGLVQMVQLMDQEFATVDRQAFGNYLWTDILKVPEDKFALMFPTDKQVKAEELAATAAENAANGGYPPGMLPQPGEEAPAPGSDGAVVDQQPVTESAIKSYLESLND